MANGPIKLEPVKVGRPRVPEPLTSISVRVPMAMHDRLAQLANKNERSISSLVRQLLILKLK